MPPDTCTSRTANISSEAFRPQSIASLERRRTGWPTSWWMTWMFRHRRPNRWAPISISPHDDGRSRPHVSDRRPARRGGLHLQISALDRIQCFRSPARVGTGALARPSRAQLGSCQVTATPDSLWVGVRGELYAFTQKVSRRSPRLGGEKSAARAGVRHTSPPPVTPLTEPRDRARYAHAVSLCAVSCPAQHAA